MCEAEPPWDSLDPGIVGVVRALHAAGFDTTDSGDGRHKASLGWDEEAWTPFPHVVITVAHGTLETEGIRLAEWAQEHGLEVQVEAHVYIQPGNPVDGMSCWAWALFLSGDALFGWAS